MASLMFGSGMRVMECCTLRVKDVDLSRGEMVIRSGKGQKDRITMMPPRLLPPLRVHLERVASQQSGEFGLLAALAFYFVRPQLNFGVWHDRGLPLSYPAGERVRPATARGGEAVHLAGASGM